MVTNPTDLGCTCYRLRQAARLVSRTYDRLLAPCGINIGQFGLLVTLSGMEGESITKLAGVLQMERTTLTRNLLPLQRLGYLAVERGPDKRARALHLTEAGTAALAAAKPKWRSAQRRLERQLGKTDLGLLHAALEGTLERLVATERRSVRANPLQGKGLNL